MSRPYTYEKDGAEIYRQSFEIVQQEAPLARFLDAERDIVVRMIHACGMVDLAKDVVISSGAVQAGRAALKSGAAIVCDVEMVQRGIIQSSLPSSNPVLCNVASSSAREHAASLGTTRSAGGMESLKDRMGGAVVVIGNAPTALFHLLEMLDDGLPPPALIIGCPVGFVGAAESKQALIEHGGGIKYVTVRGRRGGSAIAASVVNALCAGMSR